MSAGKTDSKKENDSEVLDKFIKLLDSKTEQKSCLIGSRAAHILMSDKYRQIFDFTDYDLVMTQSVCKKF